MTGLDAATVRRRLIAMRELIAHLETLGPVDAQRLGQDLGLRLQVSMALAQLITLASEVNAHVMVREFGAAPSDQRDSFRLLAEVGWIDRALSQELGDSPGLRNVIIHEYVRLDLDVVASAVPVAVEAFGRYIRQVAAHLPVD